MYSLMGSPSLRAMTGDARVMSTCGMQWVKPVYQFTHMYIQKLNEVPGFLTIHLLCLSQVSIMRHVTALPPVWPSTPPTSLWGQMSWRSWSTGNVSAGSTALSPLTTPSSTSQVKTNSQTHKRVQLNLLRCFRQTNRYKHKKINYLWLPYTHSLLR